MTMPVPSFYQQDLYPSSSLLNTPQFNYSELGRIQEASDNVIHIIQLRDVYGYIPDEAYCWRVAGIKIATKDTQMSYFRTYVAEYEDMQVVNRVSEANATFGVTGGGQQKLDGTLKHTPIIKDGYFITTRGEFMTQSSGYRAMVLDKKYPGEQLHFGIFEIDHAHQGIEAIFTLCKLDASTYPHDYPPK